MTILKLHPQVTDRLTHSAGSEEVTDQQRVPAEQDPLQYKWCTVCARLFQAAGNTVASVRRVCSYNHPSDARRSTRYNTLQPFLTLRHSPRPTCTLSSPRGPPPLLPACRLAEVQTPTRARWQGAAEGEVEAAPWSSPEMMRGTPSSLGKGHRRYSLCALLANQHITIMAPSSASAGITSLLGYALTKLTRWRLHAGYDAASPA